MRRVQPFQQPQQVLLEAGPQDLPWPSDEKCREKGMAVCAARLGENLERSAGETGWRDEPLYGEFVEISWGFIDILWDFMG